MGAWLPRIIGVTGYAQHGKDSLGQLLVDEFEYTRVGFADALKTMALRLNPVTTTRWYVTDVEVVRLQAEVDDGGWESAKKNPEVRRILQVLGTECVRDIIGPDAWVAALHRSLDPTKRYVITDVRFPNEADFIRRMDGLVVRVTRVNEDGTPFDNGVGTQHPSELHIAELDTDVDLEAYDLEGLYRQFRAAVGATV
jgi:hypothetical protein